MANNFDEELELAIALSASEFEEKKRIERQKQLKNDEIFARQLDDDQRMFAAIDASMKTLHIDDKSKCQVKSHVGGQMKSHVDDQKSQLKVDEMIRKQRQIVSDRALAEQIQRSNNDKSSSNKTTGAIIVGGNLLRYPKNITIGK